MSDADEVVTDAGPLDEPSATHPPASSIQKDEDDYDVYDSLDWDSLKAAGAEEHVIAVFERAFARPDTSDPNSGWTQDDEDRLMARWRTHPLRKAIQERCRDLTESSPEVRLWRQAIWYCHCLPTEVISIKDGMIPEYETNPQVKKLRRTVPWPGHPQELLWSPAFCGALAEVMTYPDLSFSEELRATIQYVVISATDDRRPWDPDFDPQDEFLERFWAMTSQNDYIPLKELRAALQRVMLKEDPNKHVWWGRFFGFVESVTAEERKVNIRAAWVTGDRMDPDMPIVVRLRDLGYLIDAYKLECDGDCTRLDFQDMFGPSFLTPRMYQLFLEATWLDVWREQERGACPRMAIIIRDKYFDWRTKCAEKPESTESTHQVESEQTAGTDGDSTLDKVHKWLAGWDGGWMWWDYDDDDDDDY
ncbi:hypothetical protein VTJ49DRAFT_4305 [Mycothermus thermophilus]|uniref:Uncharacterized protein n=1 Tax=Humicola insolens TaxID=85995 RepID=A0ABR3V681_HUMIN